MPAVSLTDVTKIYGEDTVALDGISFDIPAGEFVVVLGPSGAGKSTLLRILNGLTPPTEGEVYIGDERVTGARRDVGMVFQMHYLIESMSAYRNALTGALSRTGLARSVFTLYDAADKRTALEALETVGLLDEASQRAGSMSGGQKQRVGIARALVQDPNLLLADEPVASLDPKAARVVMSYMKQAAHERELTTVASLHQVNIAREFGDRFLGVRDGELVFDGTADELTMDVVDDIYGYEVDDGPGDGEAATPDHAEPTAEESAAEESATGKSASGEPTAEESATGKSVTGRSATEEPTADGVSDT